MAGAVSGRTSSWGKLLTFRHSFFPSFFPSAPPSSLIPHCKTAPRRLNTVRGCSPIGQHERAAFHLVRAYLRPSEPAARDDGRWAAGRAAELLHRITHCVSILPGRLQHAASSWPLGVAKLIPLGVYQARPAWLAILLLHILGGHPFLALLAWLVLHSAVKEQK